MIELDPGLGNVQSMQSKPEDILDGSLGYFWQSEEQQRSPNDWWSGYVQRHEREIQIEVIVEPNGLIRNQRALTADELVGITTAGGFYATEFLGWSSQWSIGSNKASAEKIKANSAVLGLAEDWPDSWESVSIEYPGLAHWAGYSPGSVNFELDDNNLPERWSLNVESSREKQIVNAGDLTLKLEDGWNAKESRHIGGWSIETALHTRVAAEERRRLPELLRPLYAMRALLSLACNGVVTGSLGRATPFSGKSAFYWNGALMEASTSARTPDKQFGTHFTLEDIGGTEGVGRWLRLVEEHPRAVGPVVAPLFTERSPNGVFVEACIGIETWIGAHKSEWAGAGLDGHRKVTKLIERVGAAEWTSLVGPTDAWAHAVWDAYNAYKHRQTHPATERLALLATTTRLLLELGLLREVVGSTAISAHFASHPRFSELRGEVQKNL